MFAPHRGVDGLIAATASRLGLPPGALVDGLWHGVDVEAANIGAITAEEYASRTAQRLGVEASGVEAILGLIETWFAGEKLDSELAAFVRELREERSDSLCVAAATNNWSFVPRLLDRHNASELFDVVISSAAEGVTKPDPQFFHIALERVDLPPERVVFLDDTEENVVAARTLGIRAIVFRTAQEAIGEIRACL